MKKYNHTKFTISKNMELKIQCLNIFILTIIFTFRLIDGQAFIEKSNIPASNRKF